MQFYMSIDLYWTNKFKQDNFCETKRYWRDSRFNVKIHILFFEDYSWIVLLEQIKFGYSKRYDL
jgi:hypothetical protein